MIYFTTERRSKMEAKEFHPGDKVPETDTYVCDICHTEGGVEGRKLKEGETFAECPNCGQFSIWVKVQE